MRTSQKKATEKWYKWKSEGSFRNRIALLGSIGFFLFSGLLHSQNKSEWFVHGGIATSTIQGGAASGFNKINMLAGLGIIIPKDEQWNIGLEGNITQKGKRIVASGPGKVVEQYRSNLFYGQVTGYALLKIGGDFSLYLGPALGYLLSSSETDFFGPVSGPSKTNFTDFELSVLGGVKYKPIDHLSFYFRFDQSVLPIVNTGLSNNNITGLRQFHTVLAIGLIGSF